MNLLRASTCMLLPLCIHVRCVFPYARVWAASSFIASPSTANSAIARSFSNGRSGCFSHETLNLSSTESESLVNDEATATASVSVSAGHRPDDLVIACSDSKVYGINRADFLCQSITSSASVAVMLSTTTAVPQVTYAASTEIKFEKPKPVKQLDSCIYTILRVREATEQETRLITTGKFKDVQRANVKLAVRFMLQNYRLADNFIAAAGYLEGKKGIEAGAVGQSAVQSLFTILEYFDSADVQNLKVGSDSIVGKEGLILRGLESVRTKIDEFISYFPEDVVDNAVKLIQEENALNEKEFDDSLGTIINLKSVK